MKQSIPKTLLQLFLCFLGTFAVVYLAMFLYGWSWVEGGNPILIEILISLFLSVLVFLILTLARATDRSIHDLKERVRALEERLKEKEVPAENSGTEDPE